MSSSRRPAIAIPGRFAEHTSANRYAAVITALAVAESVWNAGGEPLTILPVEGSNWAERLERIDGVLLPGGGDIDPRVYGQEAQSAEVYDVNRVQDAEDISLALHVLNTRMPLLAICRGMQVVNVARGGSLIQDMSTHHRNHVASVMVSSNVDALGLSSPVMEASCYHHQMIDRLGTGLEVIALSAEGYVEGLKIAAPGWAFGVQWHPEDNADTEPGQAELFSRFVREAADYRANNVG